MNGDSREFYAESVPEAVGKASRSLGVAPEQVDYSVVDEGSSGFLGIGARDARISVNVPNDDTDLNAAAASSEGDESLSEEPTPTDTAHPAVESTAVGQEEDTPDAPEDLIVAVDGFTTELLEKMGFDATVDAYDAGEVIRVDLSTKETGLLIGQKGETIDSIQHLINVVVYKDNPFIKRISVDTEGYRQRRIEALQGMAHRTARRAQREDGPIKLPPMTASERRVIHLYLKENPDISTSSEGEDDGRHVVVSPQR